MALNSSNGQASYPEEYAVMVFCERFHLTPTEYYSLPKSLVDEWTMMANLRDQIEKTRSEAKQ